MVLTSWQDQLYAHLVFSPPDQTCFSSIPRFGFYEDTPRIASEYLLSHQARKYLAKGSMHH